MSSALDKLGKRALEKPATGVREIEILLEKIRFDSTQPRKAFHPLDGRIAEKDEAYIAELAQTIDKNGLIHAITVEEVGDGTYRVVVGECRTRAHLLLGKKTIRAVVRNDLTSRSKRLIYQLVENVGRQDLTDAELAETIRELMKGGEDMEPMTQVQIAETMGKSEGWVSRFVKFGDEELQRLWIKTGIADTVEKVYRLSILPKATQVDIQRRVELPEGDIERLEKPLNRSVIDELAREAKIGKKQAPQTQDKPGNEDGQSGRQSFVQDPGAAGGGREGEGQSSDAIDQALKTMASEGRQGKPSAHGAETPSGSGTDKYQLPDDARAELLGSLPAASSAAGAGAGGVRETIQPPVNCRVSVSSVISLLGALKSNKKVLSAIDNVQCSLNIPGPLAQLIANELTGIIVDQKEVPAIVQMELSKLQ